MIRKFTARAALLLSSAIGASVLAPMHALAQTASTDDSGIQEIIVTAQKREERLQDVPIAITAVTGDALATNRVLTVADLSGLAPNVTVRPAAGGSGIPSFSARGINSYGVVPGSDKEFSIYLDGVYIGSSRASLFDLPDVDRIEVLRGPQGTLFGRNSTTGAINITTRNPDGKLGFTQEFTLGNYNEFRSRTSVSLPAVGPFSAYFSFVHDQRRGDIRNLGAGTTWTRPGTSFGTETSPRYLGDKDQNTFFAAVKFEPSDSFSTVYKFDYGTNHYTSDGTALIGVNSASGAGGLLGLLYGTQTTPVPTDPSAKRPDAVNNAFVVPGFQKNYGHSLTSTLTINDHLSLKNTAAYRYAYERTSSQIDGSGGLVFTPTTVAAAGAFGSALGFPAGTPGSIVLNTLFPGAAVGDRFGVFPTQTQVIGKQWSDELQLNYHSSLLTLTAGALWFHQSDYAGGPQGTASGTGETNTYAFFVFSPNGSLPLGNQASSFNKATSIAGYAQAEFHVTPQLDIVAGGRLTYDKKSGRFVSGGAYTPTQAIPDKPLIISPFTYSNTKPTYSVGVNYKPSNDLLIFAKYSTGFVSGGSIGGIDFKPETVRSVEGGIKAEWLNRKLITNLSVWHADYHDIQSAQGGTNVNRPDLGTVIIDQGNEKAYGFELETTLAPVRGLQFNGSVGYTHIKFGAVNPILLTSTAGLPFRPTLDPKWTVDLSGQYETEPLFADARLMLRIDANWRDKVATLPGVGEAAAIPAFASLDYQPARWIVNGRLALRNLGPAHLEVAVWAKNMTNNKDTLFPLGFSNILATSDFEPARTFGLDIGIHF